MSVKNLIRKTWLIALMGLGYAAFGEQHPFSRFPMYSHFPNWAYSFYLCDSSGHAIPSQTYGLTGGALGHQFYTWCQHLDIPYGYAKESQEQLWQVGDSMIQHLPKKPESSIQLWRRHFYYSGNQMISQDECIFKR